MAEWGSDGSDGVMLSPLREFNLLLFCSIVQACNCSIDCFEEIAVSSILATQINKK